MKQPVAIDLFCGKGGWTIGLQSVGYHCIGFDTHNWGYPGELVLQDVATLDGRQFRSARPNVIVASPPCRAYSYRAMPWKRAKALPPPDNTLFNACLRIAAEAECPIVIENVCGAQRWVGRAKWHYGSYYLWGDVPALMPPVRKHCKVPGFNFHQHENTGQPDGSFRSAAVKTIGHVNKRDGYSHTRHLTNQRESDAVRVGGIKFSEVGFNVAAARQINPSDKPADYVRTEDEKRQHIGYSRREASARIAMIPFDLARHIGQCFL